jgi:Ca-activated chloride channel family protein
MTNQQAAGFDDLKIGCILIIHDGVPASPLPLEQTTVSGQISGPVASVVVMQRFGNPSRTPIELEYLFPLPHEAAVIDYEIKIGARTIRAEIKELETARRAYREAVDEGKRASLLEQRRPNLFSIQIGNAQPGEQIQTVLRYQERLHYSDGAYEFVFPMGITPRYHTPDTSQAQASEVDAPLAQEGERIAPVEINLAVDAGVSVADPVSPSHGITLSRQDERRFSLSLPGTNIANKDFVLRYAVSADTVRAATWGSADDDADTMLISVLPPRLEDNVEPDPREFIFVIDRSGSMMGAPITQAQNALRACLRCLGTKDTFAIQAFDNQLEWFDPEAQPVTQENVDSADKWIGRVTARGGTEILQAIDAALALRVDRERQRYVVFLTDGAVSADDRAIAKISKQRGTARIFTFGIGPSVNRSLLAKMAELGRGTAEFLGVNEDIEAAITRFQDRVSYPALQDIELQWQGAEAWDTYPATLPDLYIGLPLEVVTRLKRKGTVTLNLKGKRKGRTVNLSIPVPPATASDPALRRLWARARVEALGQQGTDLEKARDQIISLALEHRLITAYTAFVAVDSEVTAGGEAHKVNVSVPLPEGLEREGFFGSGAMLAPPMGFAAAASPAPMSAAFSAPPKMAKSGGLGFLRRALGGKEDKEEKARGISLFAKQAEPDAASGGLAESEEPAAPALPVLTSIDDRIKWLARTQNVSGSWGGGASEIEMTAAALLAFARAGHTTRTGNYRRQVRKAADWLIDAIDEAGGFDAFVAMRALVDLGKAEGGIKYVPEEFHSRTPAPRNDAEWAALRGSVTKLPDPVKTLNDLRIVAMIQGEASAPAELVNGPQPELVQAWLAVGKPLA